MNTTRSRKSVSRSVAEGHLVLLSMVLILLSLGLALAGFRVIRADERGWRVSGRVVRGLDGVSKRQGLVEESLNRWTAKVPESSWNYIVLHHSASDSGSVDSIHREHQQRKDSSGNPWLGIGYHFLIGNGHGMKDGEIQATFRWDEQLHGAHSGNAIYNARGIGICLIGNFENSPPTKAQLQAVRELVKTLAVRHEISQKEVIGHAAVKPTACPGKYFPLKEIRAVVPNQG